MNWLDEQDEQRRAAITSMLDSERGERYPTEAGDDRGFAAWLLVADAVCTRCLGLSIFDIADWGWRDAYESGMTPGEALREALYADDTFATLLGGHE